ncbi:MAG: hypothetical protein NVSMB17_03790 [Candidatus Dormibacteria bacterium]
MSPHRLAPLALMVAVVAAGCGKATADPSRVLNDSAQAMAQVKTLQAEVTFGPGATVLGFQLVGASGKVKRPSDSDTTGRVKSGGALLQPELITTGGKTYLREAQFLPFHELSEVDAAGYPSAGRLLDPSTGVTSLLPRAKTPSLAGNESVDGHDCYRVEATYPAAQANAALAPITVSGDVKAAIWVDTATKEVRRVRISGHLFDVNTNSFVDVRLHDFNVPVEITAPA